MDLPPTQFEIISVILSLALAFYLWGMLTRKMGYSGWRQWLFVLSQIIPMVNLVGLALMVLLPWPAQTKTIAEAPPAEADSDKEDKKEGDIHAE